jgi:hypothetical protein
VASQSRARQSSPDRLVSAAIVLSATLLSILASGYRLDDLLIYLPMTLYLRDPTLYPNNPLIPQLLSMPYPLYRVYALVFDQRLLFGFFVLLRLALVAGLWQLGRRLLCDRLAVAAGVLLLVVTPGWFGTLGGTSLLQSEPSQFAAALPLCVFALAAALSNRFGRAVVLAAAAFNLQPILATTTLALIGADLVINGVRRRKLLSLRRACLILSLGSIVALPGLMLTLTGLGSRLTATTTGYVELVRFTAFYQVFPSTFLALEFLTSALLVGLGLPALWSGVGNGHRLSICLWLLVIALFYAIGTLFTEVWPVGLVLKMMPFRASVFLKVLCLFLSAGMTVRSGRLRLAGRAAAIGSIGLACLTILQSPRAIHIPGISGATDLEQAASWALRSTATDALFATPPDATVAGFTLYSQRSTLGDYKLATQAVWDPAFAELASERLAALGCAGPWNPWCFENRYDTFDAQAFRDLNRRYGVCFALTRRDQQVHLPVAYANASYRVYALCDAAH